MPKVTHIGHGLFWSHKLVLTAKKSFSFHSIESFRVLGSCRHGRRHSGVQGVHTPPLFIHGDTGGIQGWLSHHCSTISSAYF